ncbi:vacuolar membrane-associated protein iml1 [Nowakowskiella sp. JEL0078]|nr:vacuolar membrane-associated protein iml1 [Nowakowskiella sp. JEL0078]
MGDLLKSLSSNLSSLLPKPPNAPSSQPPSQPPSQPSSSPPQSDAALPVFLPSSFSQVPNTLSYYNNLLLQQQQQIQHQQLLNSHLSQLHQSLSNTTPSTTQPGKLHHSPNRSKQSSPKLQKQLLSSSGSPNPKKTVSAIGYLSYAKPLPETSDPFPYLTEQPRPTTNTPPPLQPSSPKASSPKSSISQRASYNLWIHTKNLLIPSTSTSAITPVEIQMESEDVGKDQLKNEVPDVVINPACFPSVSLGDLVEVFHLGATRDDEAKRLVVQVLKLHRYPQLEISVEQSLANLFGLQARKQVVVKKINPNMVAADHLELTFRDQYVGRSEMWKLKTSLIGTSVYQGKKVVTLGIRAVVTNIYKNGKQVSCGFINSNTKTIFRSKSAKYFIFIQMSSEMWVFDEDGELYLEKCIHGFLPDLFSRWKQLDTNHIVSIVLFSRVIYSDNVNSDDENDGKLHDHENQSFRDFYRVVVDWETRTDWGQVLVPLKQEFLRFRSDVLQHHTNPDGSGTSKIHGVLSTASEGSILPAINLALNPFDRHYIDRDLLRTGLSIVVITPGPGIFNVDKALCRLTTQRMVDNGVGLDLVCLSKPPLYTVPLFKFMARQPLYNDVDERRRAASSPNTSSPKMSAGVSRVSGGSGMGQHGQPPLPSVEELDPLYTDDVGDGEMMPFYMIPASVDCSFWDWNRTKSASDVPVVMSPQNRATRGGVGSSSSSSSSSSVGSGGGGGSGEEDRVDGDNEPFMLRCKMTGIMDVDGCVLMPYLDPNLLDGNSSDGRLATSPRQLATECDNYDEKVFDESKRANATSGSKLIKVTVDQSTDESFVGSKENPQLLMAATNSVKLLGSSPQSLKWTTHISKSLTSNETTTPTTIRGPGFELPVFHETEEVITPGSTSTNLAPIRINGGKGSSATFPRGSSLQSRNENAYIGGVGDVGGISRSFGSSPIFEQLRQSGGRMSPSKHVSFRSSTVVSNSSLSHKRQSLNLPNPCNPSAMLDDRIIHSHRWRHIYNRFFDPLSNVPLTNWKSLCWPACLPLTTDYFPLNEEFSNYVEYPHTFNPSTDATPYQDENLDERNKLELVLNEFISQRLAQGFQIVVGSTPTTGKSSKRTTTTTVPTKNPSSFSTDTAYHLSLGNQIHKISYIGPSEIQVTRYVKKTTHKKDPFDYTCKIWSKNMAHYKQCKVTFKYPESANYNWLGLDNLISGHENDMNESLRFWRTRFLLIPLDNAALAQINSYDVNPSNEALDEEELRIAGFVKFVEFFEKARWIMPVEREALKKQKSGLQNRSVLNVQFTTSNTSVYARQYWESAIAACAEELASEGESLDCSVQVGGGRDAWMPGEKVALSSVSHPPPLQLQVQTSIPPPLFLLERGSSSAGDNTLKVQQFTESASVSPSSTPGMPTKTPTPTLASKLAGASSASNPPDSPVISIQSAVMVSEDEVAKQVVGLLNKKASLEEVSKTMLSSETPLLISDQLWNGKFYPQVFLGKDAVDWILLMFSDIDSREDAVKYGNVLLEESVFFHAKGNHKFLDGHYFYHLSKKFTIGQSSPIISGESIVSPLPLRPSSLLREIPRSRSPARTGMSPQSFSNSKSWRRSFDTNKPFHISGSYVSTTSSSTSEIKQKQPAPLQVTNRMVIDLDPEHNKSSRREVADLHYDSIHNPKNCYHLQLQWLVCTARLIEDLLLQWSQKAEKCGLRLVEVPVDQAAPMTDDNPFQSVVTIRFAVQPPPVLPQYSVSEEWYERELLAHFGFVLDVEADSAFPRGAVKYSFQKPRYQYTQYIHRSGVAFVQICGRDESGGRVLLWVNNRLLGAAVVAPQKAVSSTVTTPVIVGNGRGGRRDVAGLATVRSASGVGAVVEVGVDMLRMQLMEFCADSVRLQKFWEERYGSLKDYINLESS